MKKTYIAPSAEIENIQVQAMMALSFTVDPNDGDGSDITTKEEQDWNIWSED